MLSNGRQPEKRKAFNMEMLLYDLMRYSGVSCPKQKQTEHSLLCKARDKYMLFSVAAFILVSG